MHIDIFPFNGDERADEKNKRKAVKNGVHPRQNINIKSYFTLVTDVRKKEQQNDNICDKGNGDNQRRKIFITFRLVRRTVPFIHVFMHPAFYIL